MKTVRSKGRMSRRKRHRPASPSWNGQEFPAVIPTIGKHNVLNALAAFAVGIEFGMQPQTIVDALTGYKPSGMRQRVVQRSDICVVEDCYNAGPDSMKAAIQTFGSMKRLQKKRGRKIPGDGRYARAGRLCTAGTL